MLSLVAVFVSCGKSQPAPINDIDSTDNDTIPLFVQCLIESYPEKISGFHENRIVWRDGDTMLYDDETTKTIVEKMDNADIEDMSFQVYQNDTVEPFNDAGRIRCDKFFKKMYGTNPNAVKDSLTSIVWCPKLVNQKVRITKINHVDKQLQKVSDELDEHPEWEKYLNGISSINWRFIAGTTRLSAHSYGIAVDIGVPMSDYWKWQFPKATETDSIKYHNRFPLELIAIFEKYGFIWGGRWYHFDTMHFEFRPEILLYKENLNTKNI